MPLPVITDGIYYQYKFSLANAQFAEVTGALTTGETNELIIGSQLLDAWMDTWRSRQCASCSLDVITVQKLDGISAGIDTIVGTDGSGGGTAVPDGVCQVVTLRTGLSGRRFRGRQYWPGFQDSTVASNRYTWETSDLANSQLAASNWLSAMVAAEMQPGVLSRLEPAITAIQSVQCKPVLGTQRRRLTGGLA